MRSYETLWHIKGCLRGSREHDGVHYGRRRVDTLVTEEEAVRSFTLVRLGCKYIAEIHVHVKSESSALMRIHCQCSWSRVWWKGRRICDHDGGACMASVL
jgi:hypothetical protein